MRGNDIGEIGRRVGERVRIVRRERGLTQDELSARLAQLDRPMPTASIGRLESGDRRVDVDDLMALAYALDVSPLSLLLPFTEMPSEEFAPAGVGRSMDALTAWAWAAGAEPHWYESGNPDSQMSAWSDFRSMSHPSWLQLDAGLNERFYELPWIKRRMAKGRGDDGEHQAEA